jgi:hypothetical protein
MHFFSRLFEGFPRLSAVQKEPSTLKKWGFSSFCFLLWIVYAFLDPNPEPRPGFRAPVNHEQSHWYELPTCAFFFIFF